MATNVRRARRALRDSGKDGNWRFKGLLLAGLRGSDFSSEDIAKAWPKPGNKGDYRFLQNHEERDIEMEMNRTTVGEKGTKRHRLLSDYAANASNLPKTLSARDGIKESEERIEARVDDAIPRMLFAAADHEEIDTLFREQLLETVMSGAERRKVAREASNVVNVSTRQGDVPVADDETFAPALAQGSEIRDDREDYATITWDTTKYGQGARVTDEMRDQAMVDIIERQIEYVGSAVENAVNRQWLTTLVDEANGNHDTTGSDQGYQALNSAVGVVDEEDFVPDTFVSHPEYRTALAADTNLAYANRAGTQEVLTDREGATLFNQIASLDMHAGASGVTYDSDGGSNTWGFANDGELGSVVYDRNHVHLFLYSANGEGMEIKDYEDPIRDLNGVNARLYADTDYSQERAAATIEF